MSSKSFLFFCFLILASGLWVTAFAQTFPVGSKVPSIGGELPKGIPSGGIGLEMLSSKPQIPYLEELKNVQSLKQSYDSLKSELTEIKKHTADSTTRDSLLQIAKSKSRELLEKESQVLEDLIQKEEIPGHEIKSAAERTLEGVERSKSKLSESNRPEDLASRLNQNEENLKALVNEWLMPKVEQMLTGTLSEGWNLTEPKILKSGEILSMGIMRMAT